MIAMTTGFRLESRRYIQTLHQNNSGMTSPNEEYNTSLESLEFMLYNDVPYYPIGLKEPPCIFNGRTWPSHLSATLAEVALLVSSFLSFPAWNWASITCVLARTDMTGLHCVDGPWAGTLSPTGSNSNSTAAEDHQISKSAN